MTQPYIVLHKPFRVIHKLLADAEICFDWLV